MAGFGHRDTGAAAHQLSVEALLLRAALLAGYGREAQPLAQRLAAVTESGTARSCLEAGSPLQLTIDAPGPSGLRVGLRLGDRFAEASVADVVAPGPRRHLAELLARLPQASHASLGAWLFWTRTRQSIFIDLRDPSPAAALARLQCVLDRDQQQRLERVRPRLGNARPWALRIEADQAGVCRVHVHWLVARHASAAEMADALAPGCWNRAVDVLCSLLRRPAASGRWVIVTPLDDRSGPGLRVGNSGWTLVPEDEQKHRAVGQLMDTLGGPRDYAEAMWSLCRGAAAVDWRVGRACEVRVDPSKEMALRARLFFTPAVQTAATAGTRRSPGVTSWLGPSFADPSSA